MFNSMKLTHAWFSIIYNAKHLRTCVIKGKGFTVGRIEILIPIGLATYAILEAESYLESSIEVTIGVYKGRELLATRNQTLNTQDTTILEDLQFKPDEVSGAYEADMLNGNIQDIMCDVYIILDNSHEVSQHVAPTELEELREAMNSQLARFAKVLSASAITQLLPSAPIYGLPEGNIAYKVDSNHLYWLDSAVSVKDSALYHISRTGPAKATSTQYVYNIRSSNGRIDVTLECKIAEELMILRHIAAELFEDHNKILDLKGND